MDFDASAVTSVSPVASPSAVDGRSRADASTPRGKTTHAASGDRSRPLVGENADAEAAAGELDQALAPYGVSLEFSRDEDTGTIVIKMFDSTSGEALKQIPNAAALKLSAEFEKLQGRLFSRRA